MRLPKLKPEWFSENGCELATPSFQMLVAIFDVERGEPCRRCNCKETCQAWPKVQELATKGGGKQ